jgi:type IV pilus assembly protein PilA
MKSFIKKPEQVIPDTQLGLPKTLWRTNQSLSITADSPRCRKQRGFTLIELMIVVAIIGILAAVATPWFINYLTKTKASECLVLLSGLKTPIEMHVAVKQTCPTVVELGGKTTGKYTDGISLHGDSDDGPPPVCIYTCTFNETEPALKDYVFALKRVGEGIWSCGSEYTTLPTNLRPASCID